MVKLANDQANCLKEIADLKNQKIDFEDDCEINQQLLDDLSVFDLEGMKDEQTKI